MDQATAAILNRIGISLDLVAGLLAGPLVLEILQPWLKKAESRVEAVLNATRGALTKVVLKPFTLQAYYDLIFNADSVLGRRWWPLMVPYFVWLTVLVGALLHYFGTHFEEMGFVFLFIVLFGFLAFTAVYSASERFVAKWEKKHTQPAVTIILRLFRFILKRIEFTLLVPVSFLFCSPPILVTLFCYGIFRLLHLAARVLSTALIGENRLTVVLSRVAIPIFIAGEILQLLATFGK